MTASMTATPKDPAFRIAGARLRLMQDDHCGLLAEVGYSLEHRAVEHLPTLATDGKTCFYNPAYIDGIDDTELETSILHEYSHVALLHPVRFDKATHNGMLANMAMDYAANLWIQECGRVIPKGWLLDAQYAGMAWEHIYMLLLNDAKKVPPSGYALEFDVKPFGMGTSSDDTATAEELSAAEAELVDRIARIAMAQELAGKGSPHTRRFLRDMTTPRDPDLYEALAALLERSPVDRSWRRMDRRMLHAGLYPGMDGEACPPLVIAIDTSGSISDGILAAFSEKVRRAVEDFRPREVTVIYCDDEINGEPETFSPQDFPALTPHGGGGTSFCPPFEWVKDKMPEQPAALVYLTDLEGTGPAEAPPYPVIWAAIPSSWPISPRFGQVVPIKL